MSLPPTLKRIIATHREILDDLELINTLAEENGYPFLGVCFDHTHDHLKAQQCERGGNLVYELRAKLYPEYQAMQLVVETRGTTPFGDQRRRLIELCSASVERFGTSYRRYVKLDVAGEGRLRDVLGLTDPCFESTQEMRRFEIWIEIPLTEDQFRELAKRIIQLRGSPHEPALAALPSLVR